MDLTRTALLVVDIQNGFITPDSVVAVAPAVNLVERWLATDTAGPVMFTRYWNYADSPYERLIGWRALYEPPATDLVDELAPFVDRVHVLDKTVYTALTRAGMELLKGHNVTDVVVCGIATDACVLKTVLDAFEFGLTPWVVRDAVASNATKVPAQQVHETALLLMGRLVGAGQLVDSPSILAELAELGSSQPP